jgi:hypothetical protein
MLSHAASALADLKQVTAVIHSNALFLFLFYFRIVNRKGDPNHLALLLISRLFLSLHPITSSTTPIICLLWAWEA